MHDYQLDRLNTRSFEQLTQALGLETLGKQLTIFGDGPDGGREATFEGEIDFPSGPTKWNGFGILQAKFRQVPDSSAKKNADWAIAQLTEEFKKFKPRSKLSKSKIHGARTCPKYYVFATNLALSAVAEKGGKDRIRTLLDGFKKSHGLTDYVVWDGDQIRRLLDTAPAIRTTYLAWVLPSDVLAEMMKLLGLQNTEFPSTITRYLESELLDDQYARLGQGGYTDANAIPLSNVFVDLPVELPSSRNSLADIQADLTHSERRTFLEVFLEAGRQNLRPSANTPHDMKSYFGEKVAGRLVLIGGPGQGKTTVGQFACQLFRSALLKQTNAQFSPEITQALARIKQQSVELPTVKALRYPLRIDLKKLAESLAKSGEGTSNSVLDYLVQHISKRTDSDLSKADFRKWLRAYPWLVVLDGLDEVPSSSNRTKMMDAIRDFVSVEAHQQDADLMILATTRPQGYSDEFNPDLYAHLPLLPLNAKEALQYGRRGASSWPENSR